MATPQEDDLCASLRAAGEELPRALHDAVIAQGAAIVPALIDLLEGDDEETESDDDGWGPIHAVDLLIELKARDAIGPMLEILCETTFEHIIHDRIITGLPALGAAVLEPALALLDPDESADFHEALCCVLGALGVRDQRIYSELCTLFAEDPIVGAMCLADYGDPRAIPLIEEAIEEFEIDWEQGVGILGLDELVDAYKQLEGDLNPELQAHVDALRAEWTAKESETQ